ncbi:MAG: hypothetical protein KDA47_10760, partial [Planctomycetales bacterium]|nr:hypothetical protein [Planctomycetales bacterium]
MPAHRKPRRSTRTRRLLIEMLETRAMMSAAPLHLDDDSRLWDARAMFESERSAELHGRHVSRGEYGDDDDRWLGGRSFESAMRDDDRSRYFSTRDHDDEWHRDEFEPWDWEHAEHSTWTPLFPTAPQVTVVIVDSFYTPVAASPISQRPDADLFQPVSSGSDLGDLLARQRDTSPVSRGFSATPPSASQAEASVRPSTSTTPLGTSSLLSTVDLSWLDQPASDDNDESPNDERSLSTPVDAWDDSFADDLADGDSGLSESTRRDRRDKRAISGADDEPLALDDWLAASDESLNELLAQDRLAAGKFRDRGWVAIERQVSHDRREDSERSRPRPETAERERRNVALMEAVWDELHLARKTSLGDAALPSGQALAEQVRQHLASRSIGPDGTGGMIELVVGGVHRTTGAPAPTSSSGLLVDQDVRLRGEAAMFRAFELSTPDRNATASNQPTPPAGAQSAKLDAER